MKISIIVLNWNGSEFISDCLASLQKLSHPQFEVEMVVVDNDSTDSSPDLIRGKFPGIKLIQNDSNLGFAEGNNVGIRYCLQRGADFVWLVNPDMVAHTGDMKATIKAIEAVDECLGEIVAQSLALDGVCVITADHGNAEKIINLQTGEIDKEHSSTPVPFLVIGQSYEIKEKPAGLVDLNLLTPSGFLADVAPTVLKILNLPAPEEMTGRSLI